MHKVQHVLYTHYPMNDCEQEVSSHIWVNTV